MNDIPKAKAERRRRGMDLPKNTPQLVSSPASPGYPAALHRKPDTSSPAPAASDHHLSSHHSAPSSFPHPHYSSPPSRHCLRPLPTPRSLRHSHTCSSSSAPTR